MKKSELLTNEEEKIDVTNDVKGKCYSKAKGYENAIEKVEKAEGIYFITFAKGYTAFGEKSRKARKLTEVKWYSRIATEEKESGFNLTETLKNFKENGILFDGKTIPEFIDTINC